MSMFPRTQVYINLSMPTHTTFGSVLRKLYYNNETLLSLAPNCRGFPNDGASHTMHISGSRKECRDFLDLVKETYPVSSPEVILLQIRIDAGDVHIRLSDIR